MLVVSCHMASHVDAAQCVHTVALLLLLLLEDKPTDIGFPTKRTDFNQFLTKTVRPSGRCTATLQGGIGSLK